jgi:hypothetical protein
MEERDHRNGDKRFASSIARKSSLPRDFPEVGYYFAVVQLGLQFRLGYQISLNLSTITMADVQMIKSLLGVHPDFPKKVSEIYTAVLSES